MYASQVHIAASSLWVSLFLPSPPPSVSLSTVHFNSLGGRSHFPNIVLNPLGVNVLIVFEICILFEKIEQICKSASIL
jgi:hypothetical protein